MKDGLFQMDPSTVVKLQSPYPGGIYAAIRAEAKRRIAQFGSAAEDT